MDEYELRKKYREIEDKIEMLERDIEIKQEEISELQDERSKVNDELINCEHDNTEIEIDVIDGVDHRGEHEQLEIKQRVCQDCGEIIEERDDYNE